MHHMIRDSFSRLVTVTSHRTTIPSPAPSPRRSAALSSSTVATSMAPELDKLPRKRCGPTAVQNARFPPSPSRAMLTLYAAVTSDGVAGIRLHQGSRRDQRIRSTETRPAQGFKYPAKVLSGYLFKG